MEDLKIIDNSDVREAPVKMHAEVRPALNVGRAKMQSVSSILAGDRTERRRFLENPLAYLEGQGVPIVRGRLTEIHVGQTTEAAVLNVAAVATVAAAVYAVLAVVAYKYLYVVDVARETLIAPNPSSTLQSQFV